MGPALRLQSGQQRLTPAQEAEAWCFAEARIAAQLSAEPVDEPETERLLQQAYAVAGLPPPQHIIWLDGPVPLVALRTPESVWDRVEESVWDRVGTRVRDCVWDSMYASVGASLSELAFKNERNDKPR